MAALAKPRRLPLALTDAERAVMAAMADLFETADQVTISRSRMALILDARKVDRLHELMDIAQAPDAEPSLAHPFCLDPVAYWDDREEDAGDEGEDTGNEDRS